MKDLDTFTASYLETALWASGGDLDDYILADIAPETLERAIADCQKFQEDNAGDLANLDLAQAGHDFLLTRNGHGAGFWDGDYEKEVGERLTKAASAFGQVDFYAHEGRVYT